VINAPAKSRSESVISRFKSLKKCFEAYSERQQQHGDRPGRDWHPAETRGQCPARWLFGHYGHLALICYLVYKSPLMTPNVKNPAHRRFSGALLPQ
jgi:hypothetical protein